MYLAENTVDLVIMGQPAMFMFESSAVV